MAPFVHRLRVRYHECDRQGVVFNAHHFTYVDVALTEMWRELFGSYDAMVGSSTDVQVVDAAATFRAPARFDDELELRLAIEQLGTTSFTTGFEERRDGDLLVSGRLVHVCVDTERHEKRPIPPEMRERLGAWRVRPA
jgi:acyl-CoA thioester hydrolase